MKRYRIMPYLILTFVAWLASAKCLAQANVQANMDSIQILIGQQTDMTVAVTAKKGANVVWPDLKPKHYLVPGVEIVNVTDADTTLLDHGTVRISRKITLTSFDESLYSIPGMKVKVNGKTVTGNAMALKVLTFDVDTLHPNNFYPPKDVQNNPFLWSEWKGVLWSALFLLLLVTAMLYMVVRLKQNKPIITRIKIVKRVPAHQKALDAIEKIKAEKMQTNEDRKTYYTQLTDTLRQYIVERFGFSAMEMTSSEIIEHLRKSGDKIMIDELREIFTTADLVKFAKYSTLINENDLNLVNAVNFIDSTKVEGQPTEERIVPELSETDMKTRQVRITIKWVIYGIVTAAAAAFCYIVYNVYLLTN